MPVLTVFWIDRRRRLVDRRGGRQVDGQGHEGQHEQSLERDHGPVRTGIREHRGWTARRHEAEQGQVLRWSGPRAEFRVSPDFGLRAADPGDPGDEQAESRRPPARRPGRPAPGRGSSQQQVQAAAGPHDHAGRAACRFRPAS